MHLIINNVIINDVINKVIHLPREIIDIIKEYMDIRLLIFTNKTNYLLYHYTIKHYIFNYEYYTRNIIKRDFQFVFEQIVRENYNKWLEIKNYIYTNMLFKNYIYFVLHFCVENDSKKCFTFITRFLKEHGLCKNQHKKNVVKYIRWTN